MMHVIGKSLTVLLCLLIASSVAAAQETGTRVLSGVTYRFRDK